MESKNSLILNRAMQAGLVLGSFWVFRYLFVIFGTTNTVIRFIGNLLSFGTPLLLFHYLVKYKGGTKNGELRFGEGVRFSVLLFFFASLLESMMVLIHVKWIDPHFISKIYDAMIDMASLFPFGNEMVDRLSNQPLPGAAGYIFNNIIMADVFLGLILSLLIVPLVMHYKGKDIV